MQLTTSAELARRLNCTVQTIANHCRRLGIRKMGRDYVLTPKQVESVQHSIRTARPGPRVTH